MSEANPNISATPGTPPASTAVTTAPPKPAASTPAKAVAKPPVKPGRRIFLITALFGSWIAAAWTTFTLSMILMTLGTLRFLFPNVLSEPPSKFKVGFPDQYEEGKVVDRFKDQNAWVVRYQGKIYALSTTCTHLGCTPNWLDSEKKFKCPCHGSGFKISGINFEGPAPRPLERYAVRKTDDNQVLVDKSRKFQQELGQWDEADSFIPMG